MVGAGAERKDRLETRQAGEQPARRIPGAGIGDVGGIAEALRPQADVAPRRQPASVLRFDQSSYKYLIHVDHHH